MSRFDAGLLERARRAVAAFSAKPQEPAAPAQPVDDDEAILAIVMPMCEHFEGFRSHPYLCSAGVPSIAFGATYYLDGRRVTLKDPPVSVAHGRALLRAQLRRDFIPNVRRLCPAARTPQRIAALADWTFNLGAGRLQASTMRKRVNAEDWPGARAECLKWDMAAGRRLRGLARRRQAEAALL
ncbi:lysozyme [Azohydromonas aeria]|uniref:lysozyme n=1 Tax=Azohydromonas aeria TaxID=2590212 RepID=UPI0012FB4035|nr:lysozyme [Azohydromonas aeria]